jgi:hypothetical protein
MKPRIFWGSCLATAFFLSSTTTTLANITFRQVSTSQGQGIGGKDVPTLEISPLWGLTLSFIKTNEMVQQVRISDPSRVIVDFDAPLGGGEIRPTLQTGTQGRTMTGATVIYLRQLGDPLKLPSRLTAGAKKSNKIPLTVITVDRANQRKLYQFLLVLGKDTKYSTVEVVPDSMMARSAQSRPTNPTTTPTGDVVLKFSQNLALAQKNNTVVPGSPLDKRLQTLLGLLQKGESLESAAQQADVPLPVVTQIMQLSK